MVASVEAVAFVNTNVVGDVDAEPHTGDVKTPADPAAEPPKKPITPEEPVVEETTFSIRPDEGNRKTRRNVGLR